MPIRFEIGSPPFSFEPKFGQFPTADYSKPGKAPPLVDEKRAIPAR